MVGAIRPGAARDDLLGSKLPGMVDAQAIQRAYDAAVAGDLDPLVNLFDPDLDWRGIERGHLWWRSAPA